MVAFTALNDHGAWAKEERRQCAPPDSYRMGKSTSSSSASSSSPQSGMSDYELQRLRNIERNNARLRELGLISFSEQLESNNKAAVATNQRADTKTNKKSKRPLSPSSSKQPDDAPQRRTSRRIQGLTPQDSVRPEPDREKDPNLSTSLEDLRQEQIRECRAVRQQRAVEYAQLSHAEQRAAHENPTATYEHCQKRIQTMTDKALFNRIKAIERAAGKHSVVKMAIFKSCLQEQGLWELAHEATLALERLKALLPPPSTT